MDTFSKITNFVYIPNCSNSSFFSLSAPMNARRSKRFYLFFNTWRFSSLKITKIDGQLLLNNFPFPLASACKYSLCSCSNKQSNIVARTRLPPNNLGSRKSKNSKLPKNYTQFLNKTLFLKNSLSKLTP